MKKNKTVIGLDVGHKRIGVALGDMLVRIAFAYDTIEVDGTEVQRIAELAVRNDAKTIVLGLPRNQSGEETKQSEYVREFAEKLQDVAEIVFQDESLTSVIAEERLKQRKKSYQKADIDAEAAAIILQDYIEGV